MTGAASQNGIDRQLPADDEIFLDHVGHFVRDADAANRALIRCGFRPTPVSIQVNVDARGHAAPTGTGNVTVMLPRGYLEVLFKTSDTASSRELDAAIERHAGLHLAAFAVADAATAQRRLAREGFTVRDLVHMQRPVDPPPEGLPVAPQAAFTIARATPDAMPEGRLQMLTHHTEQAVWQKRWLTHPNTVDGLIDVVIAVEDVAEAAARFARFIGRPATPTPGGGVVIRLDRGGINLVNHDLATERLPEVAVAKPPFMLGYALHVNSLAAAEMAVEAAGLEWRAIEDGIVAAFPIELGEGAWFFVEHAAALPWRR